MGGRGRPAGLDRDADPVRSGATVDGVRAYTPAALAPGPTVAAIPGPVGASGLAGLPALTWTTALAPDGTRTSVKTQDLVRCADDPDVVDRWESADGEPHVLDLDRRHRLAPDTPRVKRGWAAEGFAAAQPPGTVPGPDAAAARSTPPPRRRRANATRRARSCWRPRPSTCGSGRPSSRTGRTGSARVRSSRCAPAGRRPRTGPSCSAPPAPRSRPAGGARGTLQLEVESGREAPGPSPEPRR